MVFRGLPQCTVTLQPGDVINHGLITVCIRETTAALRDMTATIRGMAETIPDGSRRRRRYDGGVAVDDGRRRKLYGTEGAYTEATVCGGVGRGRWLESYINDYFCQLFISVIS